MTDALADELERLAKEATPGEWHLGSLNDALFLIDRPPGYGGTTSLARLLGKDADANAALIVALRNNLPAIISALSERERMAQERPKNLQWFASFARKHGQEVQAKWMDDYISAALREREPVAWRHAANEWADMATSGIQWLRNIRDGISTVDDALSNMDDCLKHCEATSRVAATAPTLEHQEEQS